MPDTTVADQMLADVVAALQAASLGVTRVDLGRITYSKTDLDAINVRINKLAQGTQIMADKQDWALDLDVLIFTLNDAAGVIHAALHPVMKSLAAPEAPIAYGCEALGFEQDDIEEGDYTCTLRVAHYQYQFMVPYGQI